MDSQCCTQLSWQHGGGGGEHVKLVYVYATASAASVNDDSIVEGTLLRCAQLRRINLQSPLHNQTMLTECSRIAALLWAFERPAEYHSLPLWYFAGRAPRQNVSMRDQRELCLPISSKFPPQNCQPSLLTSVRYFRLSKEMQ